MSGPVILVSPPMCHAPDLAHIPAELEAHLPGLGLRAIVTVGLPPLPEIEERVRDLTPGIEPMTLVLEIPSVREGKITKRMTGVGSTRGHDDKCQQKGIAKRKAFLQKIGRWHD